MNLYRFPSAAILVLACFMLVFTAGRSYSQERPGVRPFVKPPEGCSVSDAVDADNLFSFTLAEVQALSLAREGERASLQIPSDGEARTRELAKTMDRLRQERIGYSCAGFVVSSFTGSKIVSAATAAQYLVFAYGELGKMTNETLGITMQSAMRNSRAASTRAQTRELNDKKQEILRNMTDALNVSLSLLVDRNHELLLTRPQRLSILDYLHTHFPALADGKGGEQDDFTKQAALVQSFLSTDAR